MPTLFESLLTQLRRDEGEALTAYHDSEGWLTIGVGRCIDEKRPGCGLTREEVAYLLRNDVERVTRQLEERWPWTRQLDDARRRPTEYGVSAGH